MATLVTLCASGAVTAELAMPPMFGEHMVLQRGGGVPVWGSAAPGAAVTVTLRSTDGAVAEGRGAADEAGRWRVTLDTSSAPRQGLELHVAAGADAAVIGDVAVGQVWLCSGQSNMEIQVQSVGDAEAEMAAADLPLVRQFGVVHGSSHTPVAEVKGAWVVANPAQVGSFTATGFFFGRELHRVLGEPIGLINSSVGGTDVEWWASRASLAKLQEYERLIRQSDVMVKDMAAAVADYQRDLAAWVLQLPIRPTPQAVAACAAVDADTTGWVETPVPGQMPDAFDGSMWYRRTFELEAAGDAVLHLGRVDDYDDVYLNGVRVAGTAEENASAWATPRRYDVPASALRPGRNVLAIRVFDVWLGGGFMSAPSDMFLEVGGRRIELAGRWLSKVEHELDEAERAIASQRPTDPRLAVGVPSHLYHAMIHPLQPYALAGVIWYQGENNVGRDLRYAPLLAALIDGWRTAWDQQVTPALHAEAGRDFPFYVVQLANFLDYRADARFPSAWAALRAAQATATRLTPRSGYIVAMDIGDAGDIHPRNKQDVGRRLAALALRDTYGKDVPARGPTLARLETRGDQLVLHFDHADGGLVARELPATTTGPGGAAYRALVAAATPVKGFAVADDQGRRGGGADVPRGAAADRPPLRLGRQPGGEPLQRRGPAGAAVRGGGDASGGGGLTVDSGHLGRAPQLWALVTRQDREGLPMPGWTTLRELVEHELVQCREEGRDPARLARLVRQLQQAGTDEARLHKVWAAAVATPMREDFPFDEPSDLATIRRRRARSKPLPKRRWRDAELFDKLHGAWLGRCVGCALGKPLEGFMGPQGELSSRQRIRTYLEAADAWPLRGYVPHRSPAEETTGRTCCRASTREHIRFMESDDDIRYTVLGMHVMSGAGPGFTTWDVANAWLTHLPYRMVCTAETQAYRNLVRFAEFHVSPGGGAATDWTHIATCENPYREWIGAQIRADPYGYAAPGNPALAAEFAWRDARLSHVKNGLYGAMLVAAMTAAAFVLDDPLDVVRAGLAQVPRTGRLHADLQEVIAICRRHGCDPKRSEAVLDEVEALVGHYHPVHTNNNAALVVAAMLLSRGEFEPGITIAVTGGWDTDCNGATVGSILGVMRGARRLPRRWTAPLHDTLHAEVIGYHPIAISACARRSVAVARRVLGA